MTLDYFLFMAEAEGHDELVSTRTARLNAIAKEVAATPDCDNDDLERIFSRHNVSINSLSDKEVDYVNRKIREF